MHGPVRSFHRVTAACLGLLIAAGVPGAGVSAAETAERAGLPGAAFTTFGASVRGLALGKAYTALSDDGGGVYWNPAGASYGRDRELSMFYTRLFTGNAFSWVGYVHPFDTGDAVGLGRIGSDSPVITRVSALGEDQGSFQDSESAYLLTWSRKFGDPFSAGANLKVVTQSMMGSSAWGAGLDLGAQFRPWESLRFGLSLVDLVPPMVRLKDVTETYPMVLRTGVAVKPMRMLLLTGDVSAVGLASQGQAASLSWGAGAELSIAEILSLRGGIDPREFSLGLGATVKNIRLDYAVLLHAEGVNHLFGLTLVTGLPVTEQERDLAEKEQRIDRERRVYAGIRAARQALGHDDLETAGREIDRARSLDPRVEEARLLQEDIQRARDTQEVRLTYVRGSALYEKKSYRDADAALSRAAELAPNDTVVQQLFRLNRAFLRVSEERYKDAEQELLAALRYDPQNAEAKSLLMRLQGILKATEEKGGP